MLDGKQVTNLPMYQRARCGISYLPQEASVFRKLTVEENLMAILQTLLDISSNADPQTGYIVYYTSSASGTLGEYIYGGTSFVDPELNGVASLFVEALHGRIGLLNPALYQIVTSRDAYRGRQPAFRDITQGNNWYWNAGPGYDQATGVGVPDVANLLQALSYYIY